MNDRHLVCKMLDDILATISNQAFKRKQNNQVKDSDLQFHYRILFNAKIPKPKPLKLLMSTTQHPKLSLKKMKNRKKKPWKMLHNQRNK